MSDHKEAKHGDSHTTHTKHEKHGGHGDSHDNPPSKTKIDKPSNQTLPSIFYTAFYLIVGTMLLMGTCSIWKAHDNKKAAEEIAAAIAKASEPPPLPPEYPVKGEGEVTNAGLKVTLDPHKSHTRPDHSVRYVLARDTSIFWDDIICGDNDKECERGANDRNRIWWNKLHAGEYIVYPLEGRDSVHFKWWM